MNPYTVLAAFYDKLNAHADYGALADLIKSVFHEHGIEKGATLLDLACGTGKLTNRFAAEGYDMIGADISPEMLSEAQSAAMMLDTMPLYLCQDMRELDLYGTVDGGFCCLDSLNYLENAEDLAKVFSRLKHFIAPGGIFIFDVNTEYKFREIYGNNTYVYDEEDVYCIWQNFFDEAEKVCDFDLTFFVKEGKHYRRMEESQRERLFTHEAIETALSGNCFTLLATYGSPARTPVTDEDEKRYYVIQRQ